jgi:hypothetical protein
MGTCTPKYTVPGIPLAYKILLSENGRVRVNVRQSNGILFYCIDISQSFPSKYFEIAVKLCVREEIVKVSVTSNTVRCATYKYTHSFIYNQEIYPAGICSNINIFE